MIFIQEIYMTTPKCPRDVRDLPMLKEPRVTGICRALPFYQPALGLSHELQQLLTIEE